MAEKAKKASNGNLKKILLIVGILVLIAIIVVVIVLLVPGNTYGAVERLKQTSQTSFLQNESEKNNFDKFEIKISNSAYRYYAQELQDIESLSNSINEVLDYYDEYMVFASDNKVLKKNYKTIKNNLADSVDVQKELNSILNEAVNLSDTADSHLKNLMLDFRSQYANYLEHMTKAIAALNKSYQGCITNNLTNNLASTIILDATDDFLTVITGEFDTLVAGDKKDYTSEDYKYESHGKIVYFNSYVDVYLVEETDIMNYYFSTATSAKYEKINKFFEFYNQNDFTQVIDSISNTGNYDIELVFQTEDTEGIYAQVKDFLDVRV